MKPIDLPSLVGAAVAILAAIPVAAVAYALPSNGPVPLGRPKFNATPWYVMVLCSSAAGVAAFISGHRLGWHLPTPGFCLFSVLGIGLACADIRALRLPHAAIGILWLTCGALFLAESVSRGHAANLVAAVGSGVAVCAFLLLVALLAPGQLGLGDVNFAGAIAFSLGWISWHVAIAAIFVAFVAQWIVMKVLAFKMDKRSNRLAFGPALYGGWLLAIALAK